MKINQSLESLVRPVSSLRTDPKNARKHDKKSIKAIANSLAEFGQQKPIIAVDGVVIAGNGQLEAARQLGWDGIAVVEFDDVKKARAFAIADNRTAELSSWDDEELIQSLTSVSLDGLLTATGFDVDDINRLLKEQDKLTAHEQFDDAPYGDPASKVGSAYNLGGHVLVCGDSTSTDTWDVISSIEKNRKKSVITSPPYGTNLNLRAPLASDKEKPFYSEKEDVDAWPALMRSFTSLGLDRCSQCVVNVQMLASNKLSLLAWIHEFSQNIVDIAIWNKASAQPALAQRVMNSAFEFVFILSKDINPPRSIPLASGWRGEYRNVIEVDHEMNKFADVHRAVFPVKFAEHLIMMTTTPDVVVVDPFGGTGTTMIAAQSTKRRSIVVEKDPRYCDVIRKRWTAYALANDIDAGPGALT